ncbi:hypothetical protein SNEBB_009561, partial [Seison nebaliae]
LLCKGISNQFGSMNVSGNSQSKSTVNNGNSLNISNSNNISQNLSNLNFLSDNSAECSEGLKEFSKENDELQERIVNHVLDLIRPETRLSALGNLSGEREKIRHLAPILWYTRGVVTILEQEILNIYPFINPPTMTVPQSNRVCNALALLQCLASHVETRRKFLEFKLHLPLYPFLMVKSEQKPFEFLRLTSLGVLGALVKADDDDLILALDRTAIIDLCLDIMDKGSHISQTVAAFILHRMLQVKDVLQRIGFTEKYKETATVLTKMINETDKQSKGREDVADEKIARLLKHILRCYFRLCDFKLGRDILRYCFPQDPATVQRMQNFSDSNITKTYEQIRTLLRSESQISMNNQTESIRDYSSQDQQNFQRSSRRNNFASEPRYPMFNNNPNEYDYFGSQPQLSPTHGVSRKLWEEEL